MNSKKKCWKIPERLRKGNLHKNHSHQNQQRKVKNKYDKSNLLFHQTVIQGYKKIANPKRYIMVDASLSKDIIHKNIIKKLNL